MKIWQRYIIKELLEIFFLFLGGFYLLYALIDYSLHMQDFISNEKIQIPHIVIYYIFHFIKRADLLIPLALLIATLKTLLALNSRKELVALLSSGLPLKKILRPFFIVAACCAFFLYLNSELLLPSSLNFLDKFRESHFKNSHKKERIHALSLKDHSKIIYQTHDAEKGIFVDVYWVRSADELWRMKTLSSDPKHPIGYFVDKLQRNLEGNFEKVASYQSYPFQNFHLQSDPTGKGATPLENRKITQLIKTLAHSEHTTAYEKPQILTQILYKCSTPLICFLMIIAIVPYCIRYSRQLPSFPIYSLALFGFIAFYALLDAAVIIGETGLISPYLALTIPLTLCFAGFTIKFLKRSS